MNAAHTGVQNTHSDADLDGLPLFEAQVQFWYIALCRLLFFELAFLFHPPLLACKWESEVISKYILQWKIAVTGFM